MCVMYCSVGSLVTVQLDATFPRAASMACVLPGRERMNGRGFYLGAENLLHTSKLFIMLSKGIWDLEAERFWMPVSLLMFLFVLFIYDI